MSSQIEHTHLSNIYPLAHILGNCPLIFSSCDFLQFNLTASCITVLNPSSGDRLSERGRAVRKNTGTNQKRPHKTQSSSCAPGPSNPSFPSFADCRAASTAIHLLPSIRLPCSRISVYHPHATYFCHPHFLAVRYSSILSTCPNHLNTL